MYLWCEYVVDGVVELGQPYRYVFFIIDACYALLHLCSILFDALFFLQIDTNF